MPNRAAQDEKNFDIFNFNRWKRAVGLPKDFPHLGDITDRDLTPNGKLYIGYAQDEIIEHILDSTGAERTVVFVTPGHGASTLARYIFRQTAKDAIRNKRIPILLSLRNLDQQRLIGPVETVLRQGLVRSIVEDRWERVLNRVYDDLIGVVHSNETSIKRQRFNLEPALNEEPFDWIEIGRLAPQLATSFSDLLAWLQERHGIGVSLQVDLSSGGRNPLEARKRVNDFRLAIKNLRETNAKNAAFQQGLHELYFTSEDHFDTLQKGWRRTFVQLNYPSFGPTDVFAILSVHYPQRVEKGQRPSDALASVLDPTFLQHPLDCGKPLQQTVAELEERILSMMRNWNQVHYRLSPEQTKPHGEQNVDESI